MADRLTGRSMLSYGTARQAKLRAQLHPFTHGGHTVRELALLVDDGVTLDDVARRWGMRVRLGRRDPVEDLVEACVRDGCPEGMSRPTDYTEATKDAWHAWHAQKETAVRRWLTTLATGTPSPHCETCSCFGRPHG